MALSKNYATTTSHTSCPFKKDYSYYVNSKCLDCKFCYRNGNPKRRQASLLIKEAELNPTLFQAPVIVIRYCDPFYNEWAAKNSFEAIKIILDHGGQVIVRTSQEIPVWELSTWRLTSEERDRVELQVRCVSSFLNTGLRNILAPGFNGPFKNGAFNNHSYFFDPLIIGINDIDLKKMVENRNVDKIIIRQLFATDKFKAWISDTVGSRWSMILNQYVNGYWTYDSSFLLAYLAPIIELAQKHNKPLSFCGNPIMNEVIGLEGNCCLVKNPIGIYDGYLKNMPLLKVLK